MRILVDTSVWSLALRKGVPTEHPAVERLDACLAGHEDLFLSPVILQEILQAFRSETTVRKVAGYLEPFPLLSLDRQGIETAARLFRMSRSRGITASTIDCQIAATAIQHECLLLTADRDFERLSDVTDLRLA